MFDALTAAALADELGETIEGGRVQQVGHVDRDTLWFEVYAQRRRRYLIASGSHIAPTIYLSEREPVWDRQWVSPFLLLLRKYVRGSRLVGIQNPPLERIISLTFAQRPPRLVDEADSDFLPVPVPESTAEQQDDDDDEEDEDDRVFTHLHVEIMGRHSNLILVNDEGQIMESIRRVSTAQSRVRPIAPRLIYAPPPVQIKDDPRRATESGISEILVGDGDQRALAKKLTTQFRGLSPQTAREALYRSEHGAGGISAQSLARELRHLYEPLLTNQWSPCVYLDEDDVVVAYDAQPMQHLAAAYREVEPTSLSDAIRQSESGEDPSRTGRHGARVQRLTAQIDDALKRTEHRLSSLAAQEDRHKDRDQYRRWGEMIYGYLWQIQPGDAVLEVEGERIPLDPPRDPKDVARSYLDDYRDGKRSETQIGDARQRLDLERQWLIDLRHLAAQAESIQDIEELEAEWHSHAQDGTGTRSPKRSTPPKRTMPVTTVNGNPIYVGRSSRENDRVTFDIAKPDDTWLHARGVPGSHVIVRWLGTVPDDAESLDRAAALAAWYSGARSSARAEVDITNRQSVRKIKGAGPGMVTYRNERTVLVTPSDATD